MKEQLDKFCLTFEIIPAVDGRNLSDSDLRKYSKKDALRCIGRELSPGEIACALSHADMWRRIVDQNLDEVLILEDDVLIGEMLLRILHCRNRLPEDWELINFMTDARQVPFGSPVYDIYRACHFRHYANRTAALLINRKGAQKLLARVYPIRRAADGLTGRTYLTDLISYGITPQVAALSHFESDIWSVPHTPLPKSVSKKIQHLVKLFLPPVIFSIIWMIKNLRRRSTQE